MRVNRKGLAQMEMLIESEHGTPGKLRIMSTIKIINSPSMGGISARGRLSTIRVHFGRAAANAIRMFVGIDFRCVARKCVPCRQTDFPSPRPTEGSAAAAAAGDACKRLHYNYLLLRRFSVFPPSLESGSMMFGKNAARCRQLLSDFRV